MDMSECAHKKRQWRKGMRRSDNGDTNKRVRCEFKMKHTNICIQTDVISNGLQIGDEHTHSVEVPKRKATHKLIAG